MSGSNQGSASRISRPADQPSRTSLTQWVPRYTVVAPTLSETTADTTDSTRRVTTVEARYARMPQVTTALAVWPEGNISPPAKSSAEPISVA